MRLRSRSRRYSRRRLPCGAASVHGRMDRRRSSPEPQVRQRRMLPCHSAATGPAVRSRAARSRQARAGAGGLLSPTIGGTFRCGVAGDGAGTGGGTTVFTNSGAGAAGGFVVAWCAGKRAEFGPETGVGTRGRVATDWREFASAGRIASSDGLVLNRTPMAAKPVLTHPSARL